MFPCGGRKNGKVIIEKSTFVEDLVFRSDYFKKQFFKIKRPQHILKSGDNKKNNIIIPTITGKSK